MPQTIIDYPCPECGSLEIEYHEPVWTRRTVLGQASHKIIIEGLSEPMWECDMPDHGEFHCCFCDNFWSPASYDDLEFI
jgi:hypothetical protein